MADPNCSKCNGRGTYDEWVELTNGLWHCVLVSCGCRFYPN